MISRGIKRKITVVMVLISVLLLVSPVVFGKWSVTIDTEGLKRLHIRADIYKENGQGGPGQKHGRVQALISEIEPGRNYSYKFMLHMRKAEPGAEYYINVSANVPDIKFTVYSDFDADENPNPNWWVIEWLSLALLHIDMDNTLNGQITTTTGLLGLAGSHEVNTTKSFVADNHGSFKKTISGVINESNAIEYATDLGWPSFRQHIINNHPEWPQLENLLPPEIDFADFGIIGLRIYGIEGGYDFSGRLRFINAEDEDDVYCTETITANHFWKNFEWWAPGVDPIPP